ncbi:MAG TPA: hypothetical protein PKK26_01225 [Candidatus Wallbacteria bacterium]|nr:hypothetical protein [Candidatus Wallbacteria bacterium]
MFNISSKKFVVRFITVVLLVAFSTTSFYVGEAQANIKHLILGGVVGAGAVLAWPTISAAVGCAAGAVGSVAAGVGTAVVGAVATGGAAVGGAIAGAGVAAGSAVTAGFGAIGGAVAAITASPLFIPALLIIAAVVIGYIIYKKRKAANASTLSTATNPYATTTSSSSAATVSTNQATAATTTNASIPTAISTNLAVGNSSSTAPTTNSTPTSLSLNEGASAERKPDISSSASLTAAVSDSGNASVNAAHEKYVNAYKSYINLLSSGKSSEDSEVQKALSDYKAAFDEYQSLTKAASNN